MELNITPGGETNPIVGFEEQLVKELEKFDNARHNDSNLQNLKEFYERMRREGIATKRDYDLPSMDTVGKSICRTSSRR